MTRLPALIAAALLTLLACAQLQSSNLSAQMAAEPGVPAYHTAPPRARVKLPAILSGNQLSGPYFTHDYQAAVYRMAASVPDVLYQMPCYCWCDRALGHKSLHSCFEGTHGATCSVCLREAAYAYQQTQLGRSPVQIRKGIEEGDYTSVDLRALSSAQPGATPSADRPPAVETSPDRSRS